MMCWVQRAQGVAFRGRVGGAQHVARRAIYAVGGGAGSRPRKIREPYQIFTRLGLLGPTQAAIGSDSFARSVIWTAGG